MRRSRVGSSRTTTPRGPARSTTGSPRSSTSWWARQPSAISSRALAYADDLAGARRQTGHALSEVQRAINALEEQLWHAVLADAPIDQQGYALGVVSTILGAIKDRLGCAYVSPDRVGAHANAAPRRALQGDRGRSHLSRMEFLVAHPVLLLFLVAGVGSALGRVQVGAFSLGSAAVLFCGLAAAAIDERLVLGEDLQTFGLALFTYTVGVATGPAFAAGLRGQLAAVPHGDGGGRRGRGRRRRGAGRPRRARVGHGRRPVRRRAHEHAGARRRPGPRRPG